MLLERIDIDSCGSLERIQLGPFSHHLNAVYGPRGAGKTATLEFVRSVMLGTDRDWHRGAAGSVVWADGEGLLHCRREGDGTPAGRLSVDYVARNGRTHNHHYGYRDPWNYDRLERISELPRQTIDAIVAATRQTSLAQILEACRTAGLETTSTVHNAAAIAHLRERITDLDRQLDAYRGNSAARPELEANRSRLLQELEEFDRLEHAPVRSDARRDELTARLTETHDEIARLSHQEGELRHLISETRRDLGQTEELPRLEPAHWRIAAAHRRELEDLDNQLVLWRRTLREVCAIRTSLGELTSEGQAADRQGDITPSYSPTAPQHLDRQPGDVRDDTLPTSATRRSLEARLESVSQQIELLIERYEASPGVHGSWQPEPANASFPPASVDAPEMTLSLRKLREELSKTAHRLGDRFVTCSYESQVKQLRHSQEMLIRFIDHLIGVRNLLLRRIAAEYNVPLAQLIDAFGDWRQCHDHPHLYQWLLSDQCPPHVDDVAVHASRRRRLEQEQTDLLEQLGRTVNRLDDRANEVRLLQLQLRELPAAAAPFDPRRREACRAELLHVEERLRWLDSRMSLEHERQRHQRRLDDLVRDSHRPAALMTAAGRWLSQLDPQRNVRLWTDADGTLRLDGASHPAVSETERQTVAIALRMAAAEELGRQGHQVPLLVDSPPLNLAAVDAPSQLAATLACFAERGRQLIVFTEHRALSDAIRNAGGRLQSLAAPQYIQMRYRQAPALASSHDWLSSVNRDLDTLWREAQGLYDDPHWYRAPRQGRGTSPRGERLTQYDADDPNDRGSLGVDADNAHRAISANRETRGPASPFFLTGDSPVDQAPSIDAVAAERLARLGITRVGQLLAADPHRLAERLAMADVTARVVHRWQGEAQLVCTVPQLRNFDARVLVGCGLSDPKQLAQMHPGQLLENVETFLATDEGRRILQSGTSYELSRITSWIAAANRSVARGMRHGERQPQSESTQGVDLDSVKRASRQDSPFAGERAANRGDKSGNAEAGRTSAHRRRHRRDSQDRNTHRSRQGQPQPAVHSDRRGGVVSLQLPGAEQAAQRGSDAPTATATELPFHLQRRSPVVDAPSIGPKAAERLERIGIHTVGDLLFADPGEVAAQLGNQRIDADRVRSWQQQAALVCRVPMLRGHDAELLVGVQVVHPEQLAACDPSGLLHKLDKFVATTAGRKILRGGKQPDREEVEQWIQWARERRSLRAA